MEDFSHHRNYTILITVEQSDSLRPLTAHYRCRNDDRVRIGVMEVAGLVDGRAAETEVELRSRALEIAKSHIDRILTASV